MQMWCSSLAFCFCGLHVRFKIIKIKLICEDYHDEQNM